MVVFDKYNPVETFWELGLPFLIKEKLFFDLEKEDLGVCLNEQNIYKQNASYILINAVIITFLCAIVIGLICQINNKKERKKRLNELKEDLDYLKN